MQVSQLPQAVIGLELLLGGVLGVLLGVLSGLLLEGDKLLPVELVEVGNGWLEEELEEEGVEGTSVTGS